MATPRVLSVLRARWLTALLAGAAVGFLTYAGLQLQPRAATATASMLVKVTTSPDGPNGAMPVHGELATQAEIIRSERVARRVAVNLGLDGDDTLRREWRRVTGGQGDFHTWLAERLIGRLEVTHSRETDVVTLAVTDADATRAATLANAYVKAYIHVAQEINGEPVRQYDAYWQSRIDQMAARLQSARARLEAVQTQASAIHAADSADPFVRETTARVLSAEAGVLANDAQAATSLAAPVHADNAQRAAWLRAALDSLRGSAHPAAAQAASSAELERLEREVAQSKFAYETAVNRANMQSAESTARSLKTLITVSTLKAATPPVASGADAAAQHRALALALGLVAAVAAPAAREKLDPRLRNADDVTVRLRQPVLAVLPGTRRGWQARRAVQPPPAPPTGTGLVVAQGRHKNAADDFADTVVLELGEQLAAASADEADRSMVDNGTAGAGPATSHKAEPPCIVADPDSPQALAIGALAAALLQGPLGTHQGAPGVGHTLAVLGTGRGDGRSFVAANLAAALCRDGSRVLLIDADLHHPSQHALAGVDGSRGLTRLLAGRAEPDLIHPVPGVPELFVLPAGQLHGHQLAHELLRRPTLPLLLRELTRKFDHIVIDTAASAEGPEAQEVAARCGAAVIVARRGHSRLPALRALAEGLMRGYSRLSGVVINEA
jgi:Mrp family chromosome partitioning ATPase/uncharacterized protein involved in exopolysaccharide biosynthesis